MKMSCVTSDQSILLKIKEFSFLLGHHYWNPSPAWDDSGAFTPPANHNFGQDYYTCTSNGSTRYPSLFISPA